ncbi:DUF6906 family protein [Paenibacillus cisolokensis]|uniref:DUF6906 family protein n=1 Tax=Paenibacillus cisolokensis TaxID=1658519 RepID=UPI003D2B2A96
MKQGKKPTRRQRIEIKDWGLNPENWLVERDMPTAMVLVHRYTGSSRTIRRGA